MQIALFTKVLGERSLPDIVEIAADLGYDAIELMGRDPHFSIETTDKEAAEIRDLAADHGLAIAGVASYTGGYASKDEAACMAELESVERFCELANILGTRYIRHNPGGPPAYKADDEHYERAADWLRRAADIAMEYDIELGVEIHGNSITESALDTVRLLELINRENVSAIHDAGNMFICDETYGPASVEQLGDQLGHVHVKDIRRKGDANDEENSDCFQMETRHGDESFSFSRLGEGDIDHWTLFRALAETGYERYVTAECHIPTEAANGDDIVAAEYELTELERLVTTAERAAALNRRS